MAGTTISTIDPSNIEMRWKEAFLTAGLNVKLGVNTPAGTYRGLRLTTDAVNLHVTIAADGVSNDHYAFYLSATGYGVGIWLKGGAISLDLTAFASKTVLIAIYASYALGSSTAAEIRAYQLSPMDEFTGAAEKGEIIILGTVVVPAAGLVPAGNISHDKRTEAWGAVASDASPWTPLLRNSDFGWNDGGLNERSIAFWEHDETSLWSSSNVDSHSGYFSVLLVGTGAGQTGALYQWLHVPAPAGVLLRVKVWVKVVAVSAAGTMALFMEWTDPQNANPITTTIPVTTSGVDGAWRLIEQIVTAPTDSYYLRRVGVKITALNFAAGAAVYLDDFQVYLERKGELEAHWHQERRAAPVHANMVVFGDPSQDMAADELALWWDKAVFSGEGALWGGYKDWDGAQPYAPLLYWLGRMALGARLLANQNQAARPRLMADFSDQAGVAFTLMQEYVLTGKPGVRIYVDPNGHLIFTFNVKWHLANADKWTKDVNGLHAWKVMFRQDQQIRYNIKSAGSNTAFTDSGWSGGSVIKVDDLFRDTPLSSWDMPIVWSLNGSDIKVNPFGPITAVDSSSVLRTISHTSQVTLTAGDLVPAGAFANSTWYYGYTHIDSGSDAEQLIISATAPSTSASSTSHMLMNLDNDYRYVFAFLTKSDGTVRPFTTNRGVCIYDELATVALNDGNATTITGVSLTAAVPVHARRVLLRLRARNTSSVALGSAIIRPTGGVASSTTEIQVPPAYVIDLVPNYADGRMDKDVWVNTNESRSVSYLCSANTVHLTIDVLGWSD